MMCFDHLIMVAAVCVCGGFMFSELESRTSRCQWAQSSYRRLIGQDSPPPSLSIHTSPLPEHFLHLPVLSLIHTSMNRTYSWARSMLRKLQLEHWKSAVPSCWAYLYHEIIHKRIQLTPGYDFMDARPVRSNRVLDHAAILLRWHAEWDWKACIWSIVIVATYGV